MLAEIGPFTPVLDIKIVSEDDHSEASFSLNCLDIWSHYNRKKCIKIMTKSFNKGIYKIFIKASSQRAIDEIEVKKPVDRKLYPVNKGLELMIDNISSNASLTGLEVI